MKKKIVVPILILLSVIVTSCKQTILTVEAPESYGLESELSTFIDELRLNDLKLKRDDLQLEVDYSDGRYRVTAARRLTKQEKQCIKNALSTAKDSKGSDTLPITLEMKITEKSKSVLDLLKLKTGDTFKYKIENSDVVLVTRETNFGINFFVGVKIVLDKQLSDLHYEFAAKDTKNETENRIVEQFSSLGAFSADYELYFVSGNKRIKLDQSIEKLENVENTRSYVLIVENIHNINTQFENNQGRFLMPDSYFSDKQEAYKKAVDFIAGKGFSSEIISYILYPYLSKTMKSYEL